MTDICDANLLICLLEKDHDTFFFSFSISVIPQGKQMGIGYPSFLLMQARN